MPVHITRKTNMAFRKDRGFWKNVEDTNFTFTSKDSKRNLASHRHHIIVTKMQSFNVRHS